MSDEINYIVQLLNSTSDPRTLKQVEAALRAEEAKPQFSIRLLQIIATPSIPLGTRVIAAIHFKNFIHSNYVDEDGNYKLPESEVQTIKQELVALMTSVPKNIQNQLAVAISNIADSDFWRRWDTLTTELSSRLTCDDPNVTKGVLEVAHSIFVRWRPLFRSDELFREIIHVADTFGESYINALRQVHQQIENNKGNPELLKAWFENMTLLIEILYDLSCQDLPPIIESNLDFIMGLLQFYLTYASPDSTAENKEAPTVVEEVKTEICEVLQLYTTKYDEDFGKYTETFAHTVLNLVATTGTEQRYDIFVSKALQFLTAVAASPRHAANFSSEEAVKLIIKAIILPNIQLRDSDMELFNDEPIEFIRRDLEGSDTDSRRRAATDFLRRLLENSEVLVTGVVSEYVELFLAKGQTDWKAKDTAIYLFLATAAKGTVTAAQGVKSVNQHVQIVEFFKNHVAADLLSNEANCEPIAKVDAIKYLHNFRSQLTKEDWQAAMAPLVESLNSDNYVIYTYAAIALERVLVLTDDAGVHLFSRAEIQPHAFAILDRLFKLIQQFDDALQQQENEFIMRCIVRVLIVIKDGVLPMGAHVLDRLMEITNTIRAKPSNPRFYYYHFEAIGALVRYSGAQIGGELEKKLWNPFMGILGFKVPGPDGKVPDDVKLMTEFAPYVLQIQSVIVEASPGAVLPSEYNELVQAVLEDVWQPPGLIPAWVRLLSALLPKVKDAIVSGGEIPRVLELFSKLFAMKKADQHAFDLLEAVVTSLPPVSLEPFFTDILRLVLKKLHINSPDSFKIRLVRLYHLVSAMGVENGWGADYFIRHVHALDNNPNNDLFRPLYPSYILPVTTQFARPVDRKLAVISYTKTVCDSKAFAEKYVKGRANTCLSLLDLLKNPPQVTSGVGDEVVNEADVDDIGFGIGYTPLNTCKRGPRDDFPEVENAKQWVGTFIKEANVRHNGEIFAFVAKDLQPEPQAALASYLA
ncbi:chromosome segregation protein [Niveomyces insectorum RCEF 264]|uniref:Chromosome segregation protein n=1 Tax=Niveomyces insectorum RCEF 264 TaxID=1081102 RepID=A0A167X426_9HYPO|nr:chromosome segregation protein [Niveomyces insectorum RCEF 264]